MELISNKNRIAQFYKNVVGLRKSELITDYVSKHYIQHSPMGKDGREGLTAMVEFLKTLPMPEVIKSPIVHMIAEGDYVVAHLDLVFMGKHTVLIELFRLQDGLAVEHWDVTQDQSIKEESVIDIAALNDSGLVDKVSIEEFYQQKGIVVHHLINEDEYVAIHSQIKQGDKSFALFDIFKVEDGKVIEHNYVKQEVPKTMPHGNGMF